MNIKNKKENRNKRHKRVRSKIVGSTKRPRLSVFRSNKHIYAQIIDDEKGKTLASARDTEIKEVKNEDLSGKKVKAFAVGELIAEKAKDIKIKEVVFDRGGYKYHGRVKALAEGARSKGLVF